MSQKNSLNELEEKALEGLHPELYELGVKIDDGMPSTEDTDRARKIVAEALRDKIGGDLKSVKRTCLRFRALANVLDRELKLYESERRKSEMKARLGG